MYNHQPESSGCRRLAVYVLSIVQLPLVFNPKVNTFQQSPNPNPEFKQNLKIKTPSSLSLSLGLSLSLTWRGTRTDPTTLPPSLSLGFSLSLMKLPRVAMFGVLRGEGAVMLSYNSVYTYSITNSPCTSTLYLELYTP